MNETVKCEKCPVDSFCWAKDIIPLYRAEECPLVTLIRKLVTEKT